MNRYLISDIHGCALTFRHLVTEVLRLKPADELFLLGDYIDRGPNSKGVIDFILQLKESGYRVETLCGNHEQMLLDAQYSPIQMQGWRSSGGEQTLESYGGYYDLKVIPEAHWQFLEGLKDYLEIDGAVLVHGGLNFDLEDPLSDRRALLWGRYWQADLDREWLGNRLIVHGHTPIPKKQIEQDAAFLKFKPVLDIDAGCYIYGHLCAFELNSQTLHFQENIDFDTSEGYR